MMDKKGYKLDGQWWQVLPLLFAIIMILILICGCDSQTDQEKHAICQQHCQRGWDYGDWIGGYACNCYNITDEITTPINNFTINYTGCPDCNCDSNKTIINNCENDAILSRIDENIIKLQNKEVDNSTNNIYIIENYIGNRTMERSIHKIEDTVIRIETSIKNNLTMK